MHKNHTKMKKIFTLAAALLFVGAVSFAQDAAAPKKMTKKTETKKTETKSDSKMGDKKTTTKSTKKTETKTETKAK